jgi:protein-S-isoprenylcysteine O-methyltransferase Ste14
MSARLEFLFGRALPLGIFGFLVAIQGQLAMTGISAAMAGQLDRAATMYAINRVLTLAFFTFLLVIYLVRGRAVGTDHSPLAVFFAMLGTFILYALWLVPAPRTDNLWVLAVSDILLSFGMVWALYSLSYLRHRFSIVPEARGLVTTGPYEVVRHPVYLGEITSALGLVLPSLATFHLLVFVVFVFAQLMRTRYEEAVLRQSFREYPAYASRTRRLIPFLF